MVGITLFSRFAKAFARVVFLLALAGCAADREELPDVRVDTAEERPFYQIGPGDSLTIFVWKNPDLTTSVPVRPDGRISVPLLEDLDVTGKTPTDLAAIGQKILNVDPPFPVTTMFLRIVKDSVRAIEGGRGR